MDYRNAEQSSVRNWLVGLALLICTSGTIGCSAGDENPAWAKRYRVTGTVKLNGQPVENADVSFFCEEAQVTATGKTDGSGKFELTTYLQSDGAVAGKHIVTIRRVDVIDQTPKDVDVSAGGVALPPKITWIVPEKYSLPAKSGLTAVVSADGPNDFVFDVK